MPDFRINCFWHGNLQCLWNGRVLLFFEFFVEIVNLPRYVNKADYNKGSKSYSKIFHCIRKGMEAKAMPPINIISVKLIIFVLMPRIQRMATHKDSYAFLRSIAGTLIKTILPRVIVGCIILIRITVARVGICGPIAIFPWIFH